MSRPSTDRVVRSTEQLLLVADAPLWSLRCSRDEYQRLRQDLNRASPRERWYPKLFVLAAAEAIRREYRGGAWSWDIVSEALDFGHALDERDGVVEAGLAAWGRPVRQSRGGAHLRLSSLICEAGIATQLLVAESGAIRAWSQGVIRDFSELGFRGDEDEDDLAEVAARRARARTQTYLRDAGVHLLFGRLLGALWHLRVKHGAFPGSDTLAWLDLREPEWRERLPLDLDDAAAEKLIIDLLGDADEVARPPARPLVRTRIVGDGLEREIVLPPFLSEGVMGQLFGSRQDFPRRMQITVLHAGRRERIAQLERTGDGWRCVSAPRSVDGAGQVRMELEGGFGKGLPAVGVVGSTPLPELPWVFAEDRDGWRLVGVGSVCHPAAKLRVATSDEPPISATRVGPLEGRTLVEIHGETVFTCAGLSVRVRPRSQLDDEAGELVLDGERYVWARENDEVFVGTPAVWCVTGEGARRRIPSEHLSVSEGQGWRPWPPSGGGRVRLRWTVRGDVRGERSFGYVPSGFAIAAHDVGPDGGVLEARPAGSQLAAAGSIGFDVRHDRGALRVSARPGERPPARVDLRVLLGNGREVLVCVPFPCERDAFFDRGGRAIAGAVGLHDLSGLRAEARRPSGRPALFLRLVASARGEERLRRFPASQDGLHSMELRDIRGEVAELFSTTDDQDARVSAEIHWLGSPSRSPMRLEVRRYDRSLVPNKDGGTVSIEPGLPQDASVEVLACRFVAPAVVVRLQRLKPGWRWIFDAHEPGSWLIAARDAFAPVARPVAWFVPGEDGTPGQLAAAMRFAPQEERCAALREALLSIAAGQGTEGDAALLDQSVALLEHAEASALDVVRTLAGVPTLAARLAVFAVDAQELARLWDGLDSLPFLWETVPVRAWEGALNALHSDLLQSFPARPERAVAAVERAADAIHARFNAFDVIYQPWRVSKGLDITRADPVTTSRAMPSLVQDMLKDVARLLRSRHAEDEWPTLAQPHPTRLDRFFPNLRLPEPDRHLNAHCWPVQIAPTAAAASALAGTDLSAEQVRYLRHLRAFDRDWFEDAHALTLTLMSARQPVVFR